MGGSEIKSLKRIDNQGVMDVWDTFAEKKKRFTAIGDEILNVHKAIGKAWEGTAYREYLDQFNLIFSQVNDIGDALIEIADALKDDVYDSFYVADDSLNQQLLEAQHNTQKGSSGKSDGGDAGYRVLQRRAVLYSTIRDAYMPNLAYPQLPARPILVSTIGQAYKPNMAYHAMSPKPVLASCLPSAKVINIIYRNLPQRATLASVIGDAVSADVSYAQLALRAQLSSTIGDMMVPDLSYVPLAYRSMENTSLAQICAFLLEYAKASPNLQKAKNTLMAARVNQIVIESLATGRSDAETASLIGEAIVGNIHGKLDGKLRATLVTVIGNNVFQRMYGRAPGETGSGKPINWIDTGAEKAELGMVRNAVKMIAKPVPKTFPQNVTGMKPGKGAACVLSVRTGVGAVNTTEGIIAPRKPIGPVAAEKVIKAMSQLANADNHSTIVKCICQSAAEATGAASLITPGATSQSVTGNAIVISAGAATIASDTVSSVISGNLSAGAQANISDVVGQWSAQAGKFDFSSLKYPVAAGAFSAAS